MIERKGGTYFLFLPPITFLMSFFGLLVPGVPINCMGGIADAPTADIVGKDDGGAGTGGGVSSGAGAGIGSGGE
jgi:hypothetical protein